MLLLLRIPLSICWMEARINTIQHNMARKYVWVWALGACSDSSVDSRLRERGDGAPSARVQERHSAATLRYAAFVPCSLRVYRMLPCHPPPLSRTRCCRCLGKLQRREWLQTRSRCAPADGNESQEPRAIESFKFCRETPSEKTKSTHVPARETHPLTWNAPSFSPSYITDDTDTDILITSLGCFEVF